MCVHNIDALKNSNSSLVELPMMSESEMLQDFSKLYSETFIGDDFHDIVIKVIPLLSDYF